jgi:hypothetical protein
MSENGNPYDPINRIIRISEPLAHRLFFLSEEVPWITENAGKARMEPTEEQMNAYLAEHTAWKSRRDQEEDRKRDLKDLYELYRDRYRLQIPIPALITQKVEEYCREHNLEDLDAEILSHLIRVETPSDEIESAVKRRAEYLVRLRSSSIVIGPEPIKPIYRDPALHDEFERRYPVMESFLNDLPESLAEFESATRAWPPTANEDFDPVQRAKTDYGADCFTQSFILVNECRNRALGAKEALKRRGSEPVAIADKPTEPLVETIPKMLSTSDIANIVGCTMAHAARIASRLPSADRSSGVWKVPEDRVNAYAARVRARRTRSKSTNPLIRWTCGNGHLSESISKPRTCSVPGCRNRDFMQDD